MIAAKALPPGLEPGLQDSKSWVLTTTLWEHAYGLKTSDYGHGLVD